MNPDYKTSPKTNGLDSFIADFTKDKKWPQQQK